MEPAIIRFTIIIESQQFVVEISWGQYQSLMTLIVDRFNLADFGLCCGMGSCGTCDVTINGIKVLACETAVDASLKNSVIRIHKQLIQAY